MCVYTGIFEGGKLNYYGKEAEVGNVAPENDPGNTGLCNYSDGH